MSTIKDEIIGIAEEQGYEGEAPKTIAQAVNALGTVIGGGGSGGGGGMVVTIGRDQATGNLIPDKSFDEIKDYINGGGRDVIVYYDASMSGYSIRIYHLDTWNFAGGAGVINFTSTSGVATNITTYSLTITSDAVSTSYSYVNDASPLVVSFSVSGSTYTASNTNDEIVNAFGNGRVVFGKNGGIIWHLVYSYGGAPYFATVDAAASTPSVKVLTPSSSVATNKTYTVKMVSSAS